MSVARRSADLVVVSPLSEWTCAACGSADGGWLVMEDPGPLCMACADLAHLVFLPSGDAALTHRARKHSGLSAVLVRLSRARKRYERQGVLVEEAAIEQAEEERLADEDTRARRRERERRSDEDLELQRELASEIRHLFPGCPRARAQEIARRTGDRGSGRVGRTAAPPPRGGRPPRSVGRDRVAGDPDRRGSDGLRLRRADGATSGQEEKPITAQQRPATLLLRVTPRAPADAAHAPG